MGASYDARTLGRIDHRTRECCDALEDCRTLLQAVHRVSSSHLGPRSTVVKAGGREKAMGLMRGNENDRLGWGAGEGDGCDEWERGQRAGQDISLLVSSSF